MLYPTISIHNIWHTMRFDFWINRIVVLVSWSCIVTWLTLFCFCSQLMRSGRLEVGMMHDMWRFFVWSWFLKNSFFCCSAYILHNVMMVHWYVLNAQIYALTTVNSNSKITLINTKNSTLTVDNENSTTVVCLTNSSIVIYEPSTKPNTSTCQICTTS